MGTAGDHVRAPVEGVSAVKKRSVLLAGHKTSLSLEEPFWRELKEIASAEKRSLNALLEIIDRQRNTNLSSAARLYVLERLKARI